MTTPYITAIVEVVENVVEVTLPGYRGPEGPQGEVGPQGEEGPQGDQGEPGLDGVGTELFYGIGAPSSGLGVDGDAYVRSDGTLYKKLSGTWTDTGINLTGPQGATGATGATGAQGPTGATGAAGATGATGPTGPQGPAGADGDDGADGDPGPAGDDGAPGADGAPGSVLRNGAGAPSNGLGINGDYYLNDTNGDVYEKSGGTYSVVANIMGPQGPEGPQGDEGPAGSAGAPGDSTKWYVGFGVPEDTTGDDEDDYLNLANGDIYQFQTSAWVLVGNIAGPPGADAVASGSYMLAGGNVAYTGTGYVYRVSAASYFLNGVHTTSVEGDVTLDAADGTNDRIDVIVLGAAGPTKITGTAAVNPVEPSIDETAYIRRSVVYVAAASSTPTVTVTPIYTEGAEWTVTTSGGTIVKDNTTGPRTGTNLIRGTNVPAGQYWEGATSAFDVTLSNSITFYVDPIAAWAKNKVIAVTWYNSTTQRGTTVNIANGSYGFNSQVGGAYQQIVVPISAFNIPTGTTVTKVRWAIAGGGANVGFRLDDVQLQGGVGAVDISDVLHWRGTWASATAYNKNDVVFKDGSSYVALLASVGQDPASAVTYWTTFAASGTDGALSSDTFSYFDPDKPPSSPTSQDDEFTGNKTAFDAKFTGVNWSGLSTYDLANGKLYAEAAASNLLQRAALQALPAGDFTIWAKVRTQGKFTGGAHFVGVMLSDGVTNGAGGQAVASVEWDNTNNRLMRFAGRYTNFTGAAAATLYTQNGPDEPVQYIRWRRSSTNYYIAFSTDGSRWDEVAAFTLPWVAAYFGPAVRADTGASLIVEWEFLRYVANSSAALGSTRNIGLVEPRHRGTWAGGTSYAINDMVRYGSNTYIALEASTGVTPGTDATKWIIFAEQGLPGDATNGFTVNIDGGGYPIVAGLRSRVRVPYDCSIVKWDINGDAAGSVVVDVRKAAYNGAFSSIAGSEKPTLASDDWNQDTNLSSWSPDLSEGDWLEFYVESVTTLTFVSIGFGLERDN